MRLHRGTCRAASRSAGRVHEAVAFPACRTLALRLRAGRHAGRDELFKAYSTDFVREVGIDSRHGFEIGLELTAKARRLRLRSPRCRRSGSNASPVSLDSSLARGCRRYLRWYRLRVRSATRRRAPQTPLQARVERRRSCVTGASGFIGGYVVEELLGRGHDVVGVDNYSKYGPVERTYDTHPGYRFVEGDARDVELLDLAAGRLRSLHRRRGDDRWDLVLPRVRLRPAGDERADHRGLVRRRNPAHRAGQPRRRSRT